MTKSKKSIVMHGTLLAPLVLGYSAYLRANGSDYRTAMQMLFAGLVSAPPEDHANG